MLSAELLTKSCTPHLKKIRFKWQHKHFVALSTSDFEKDSPGNSIAHKTLIFLGQQKVPYTSSPYSSSKLCRCTSGFGACFSSGEWSTQDQVENTMSGIWWRKWGLCLLIMIIVSLRQRGTAESVCLGLSRERTIKGISGWMKETHEHPLPVHAAEIQSSISPVNKFTEQRGFAETILGSQIGNN